MSLSLKREPTVPTTSQHQPIDQPMYRGLMRWLVEQARVQPNSSRLARYGIAIAAVAVATVFRTLFDPLLEHRTPYGFYVIAMAFTAWRCGFGPALLSILCGLTLGNMLFEEPRGGLAIGWGVDQAAFFVTLILGLVIAVLSESLRASANENAQLFRLARQSELRKDEFLAMLAHELRNPLAPICNALYLLETVPPTDQEVPHLRQIINGQVNHLCRLVDDLLDVSRITQGKIELQLRMADLKSLVDSAVEIADPLIREKRHQLVVSLPPHQVELYADPVRIVQVFANLLNNAAKYSDDGGRIWLTAHTEGQQLIVCVRDTGIGIAPEMQSNIFDVFQQVSHTIEQSRGGLGLGLTLVRTLVSMHHGSIEVYSGGLGLGSEFTVRLPIESAASLPAPQRSLPAVRSTSTKHAPLRVLVVDDLVPATKSLEAVLRHWGHQVQTCFDAFAALEMARTFQPQVVLSDLGLPQMNGFQLGQELRRLPGLKETALIAISGYGEPADRQKSAAAGFDRHLIKPVDLQELEQLLLVVSDQHGENNSAANQGS